MNLAHVHLILNHLPVVGFPLIFCLVIYSFLTQNKATERFSLGLLFLVAASVLPVFLTGEPAEDLLSKFPEVSKATIEGHEEAAQISAVLSFFTAIVTALYFLLSERSKKIHFVKKMIIGFAIAAIISLAYTAFQGGKIRHPEIQIRNSHYEIGTFEVLIT